MADDTRELLIKRFMEKVFPVPIAGCWLWDAATIPSGYGRIQDPATKKVEYAHRISYRLFVGPIPEGCFVCHRCDVTCCVNPAHLFTATHIENMADMLRKGRYPTGGKHYNAKLSDDDVAAIRFLKWFFPSITQRQIASQFEVNESTVSQIICGKRRERGSV